MLATLLTPPQTPEDWNIWSFAHERDHLDIAQAIVAAGGPTFQDYQLDPIPAFDIRSWLQRNQQAHHDMNGVLRLQSADLQRVDLEDENQARAWIWSHYSEHNAARTALRI